MAPHNARQVSASLALILTERLRPLLPQGLVISASGGTLRIQDETGMFAETELESIVDQDGDASEHLRSAALAAMNLVQDFASEHLRRPWPVDGAGGPSAMPTPDVSVTESTLRMWFGGPDAIQVSLGEVQLSDVPGA